jgi:Fic family protein
MPKQSKAGYREVELTWSPELASFGTRASRRRFTYRAYVPDPLAEREWLVPADLSNAMALVERSCRALEDQAAQIGLDTVARQLLRADSIASSRIEGLILSNRRLARADATAKPDLTAQAVLANVRSVENAYEWAHGDEPFSTDVLRAVHRHLFEGTFDEPLGGMLRGRQNWIGGEASSPRTAEFVPPPWQDVEPLLDDLAIFCNRGDVPALLQAAVAHAQFETIHPFMDGNGRAGRALIGMVLLRRGVLDRVVPPVSLVLAGEAATYVQGLTSYRYSSWRDWVAVFTDAVSRAAGASEQLAVRVGELQRRWRGRAGEPRAGSAASRLIDALPAYPVLTLASAVRVTGLSDEACRNALNALETAGVLRETTAGRRNRVWESVGLFELLDTLEREAGAQGRAPALTRRG